MELVDNTDQKHDYVLNHGRITSMSLDLKNMHLFVRKKWWQNWAIFLVLIVGMQCHLPTFATEKPRMTWMLQDLPPGYILVNGLPTTGFFDTVIHLLIEEWPEADHKFSVLTVARGMANLKDGVDACFGGIVMTPEREKLAYFSLVYQLTPLQLIARPEVIDKLPMNSKGEAIAESLFDRADLRGNFESQRSYGVFVDTLIKNRNPNSGIKFVTKAGAGANTFQMLMADRSDYTVGYDFELVYQKSVVTEMHNSSLVSLPIAGNYGALAGIACPHTEWGRQAVKKIDALMVKIAQQPKYQNAFKKWLTPEAEKHYRESQDAFFRARTKPTDPSKFAPWPKAE